MPEINPIQSALGPEAQISGVGSLGTEAQVAPTFPTEKGFGTMLTNQVQQLNEIQQAADAQAQAFASGQAVDITEVVLSAERAQLSLQLATQMRNQLVNAYQELLRTQA